MKEEDPDHLGVVPFLCLELAHVFLLVLKENQKEKHHFGGVLQQRHHYLGVVPVFLTAKTVLGG